MKTVLEIDGISKEFGGKTVVDNVSFNVAGGEIMGLVGPNGAGKSTIIRTILGIIYPDSGNIRFFSAKKMTESKETAPSPVPESATCLKSAAFIRK